MFKLKLSCKHISQDTPDYEDYFQRVIKTQEFQNLVSKQFLEYGGLDSEIPNTLVFGFEDRIIYFIFEFQNNTLSLSVEGSTKYDVEDCYVWDTCECPLPLSYEEFEEDILSLIRNGVYICEDTLIEYGYH